MTEEVTSDVQLAKLKVSINGRWTAESFAIAFDSFDKVYRFNQIIHTAQAEVADGITNQKWSKKNRDKDIEYSLGPIINRVRSSVYRIFDYEAGLAFYKHDFGHWYNSIQLSVKRVNFNSPGGIDFVGMGKALEVIKDWFTFYKTNEEGRLNNELKRIEIEEKKMDLLKKKIEMFRELGIPVQDITAMLGLEALHLEKIGQLHQKGLITDVEVQKDVS